MKTLIITLLISTLCSGGAIAQNYNELVTYRVLAVEKGNTTINSISNEVEVKSAPTIYIPNAFTPNGDGLNDTFGAVGSNIVKYNMQIYDRWGALLFESNDPNKPWNGSANNTKAQSGVYVYKISAQVANNKLFEKTGYVTLVL